MAEYSLGTARGRIELDASGAERGALAAQQAVAGAAAGVESTAQRFSQGLDRVGTSMMKVGAVATAGLTVPIVMAGNKAVDAAASYEDAMNRVQVSLGDAADETIAWSSSLLDTHGVGKRLGLDMVSSFAEMALAQGATREEAVELGKRFTTLAADASSYYDLPHAQVQSAISAGLRGEYQQLEQLNVFMRESDVTKRALIDTGKAQESQLTATEKAAARQAIIIEQLNKVEGDFARTADSVNNTERRQREQLDNLSTEIGEKLIPVKQRLLEVTGRILDTFQGLSPQGQTLALVIAGIAAAIGPVLIVLGAMVKGMSSIIDLGIKIGPSLGTAVTKVGEFGAAVGRGAVSVATATGRMIADFARATASMIADMVRATGAMIANVARQVVAWILLGAQALAAAARVALAWLIAIGPIALVIAAVIGLVALIIKNWDTIKKFTIELWNTVKAKTLEVWNAITSWLSRTWQSIVSAVTSAWDRIKAMVSNAWNAVKTTTMSVVGSVITFVASIPGKFISALVNLVGMLAGVARNAWNAFFEAVKSVAGTMFAFVRGIPGKFVDNLKGIGTSLYNIGKDAIESIIRGMKAVIGRVTAAAREIKDKIVEKLNPVNWFSTPEEHYRELWGDAFDAIQDQARRHLPAFESVQGAYVNAASPALETPRGTQAGGIVFTFDFRGANIAPGGEQQIREAVTSEDVLRQLITAARARPR